MQPHLLAEAAKLREQYSPTNPVFRTKVLTHYNCHGLTFASRRTRIWKSPELQHILVEDGYEELPREQVLAGDVIVYFHDGDAEHSGIVVGITGTDFRVVSKWGFGEEVEHWEYQCPYDPTGVKYYRVKK